MTRTQLPSSPTPDDPFDLDVVVIQSGASVAALANSDGGCGATCRSSVCTSSGA